MFDHAIRSGDWSAAWNCEIWSVYWIVRLDEYIECGTRSADGARAVAGDELSTISSKPPPPPGGGFPFWVVSKWRTLRKRTLLKGACFRSNCEVRVVDCVLWDYVNRLVLRKFQKRAHTNAQENGRATRVTNPSCPAHGWVMSQRCMDGSLVTDIKRYCHAHIWLMSHIWTSRVTRVNESCPTCECDVSRIWLSRFKYGVATISRLLKITGLFCRI